MAEVLKTSVYCVTDVKASLKKIFGQALWIRKTAQVNF